MKDAHALIEAVIDNDVEAVNKLLNRGIDPNLSLDDANITPLHFAAQGNCLEVIPVLVNAGANVHAETEPDGQTPLDIALLHKHDRIVQLLIAYGAKNGDDKVN